MAKKKKTKIKKVDHKKPSRRHCWTIFDRDCVPFLGGDVRYLVYSIEVAPDTGKLHLQGYSEHKRAIRGSALQKLWGSKFHYEVCGGDKEDNFNYCTKDSITGRYYEFGESCTQGTRTDISDAVQYLKEGKKYIDIVDDLPEVFVKYHRGLKEVKGLLLEKQSRNFREVSVSVLWGDAGAGKSRSVLYEGKSKERKDDIYDLVPCRSKTDAPWWDGYVGQDTLFIEEFYGWMPYSLFLRVLDGHQLKLPTKGGFTWACYTKVVITSNVHPSEWYSVGMTPALKRRISSIKNVTM